MNKFRLKDSVFKPLRALWVRGLRNGFETEEQLEAHKKSIRKYNKAGYDYEYLFNLEKHQLVYKVIRLQRQVDSYTVMKSVTNVDGRDKIRVDHPDPEDVIDHSECNHRRVTFKVAYLGWDYMSYAWSENSDRAIKGHTNNVERVFMEALLRQQLISGVGRKINLDRAGRTDSTVSGLSQVIAVNVRSNLDEGFGVWKMKSKEERDREKELIKELPDPNYIPNYLKYSVKDRSQDSKEIPYVQLLNEALPTDIRVLAWSPVRNNFSLRGGCVRRTYRYFFPKGDLDIDLMHRTAQKLVGIHDFRNFGKVSSENMNHNFEKELKSFDIEIMAGRCDPALPECDICCATVSASGFIYNQVRLMMSVLMSVGCGVEEPSIIDTLLDTDKVRGRPSYPRLGGIPLLFYDAEFHDCDIDWRWDGETLQSVASTMGELWSHNAMKSEIIRAIYSSALQNLNRQDRMDIRNVVHFDVIKTENQSSRGKKILEMDKAKDVREFRDKEVERTIRRLQKKGRYNDAKNVKAGTSDVYVGWASERQKAVKT